MELNIQRNIRRTNKEESLWSRETIYTSSQPFWSSEVSFRSCRQAKQNSRPRRVWSSRVLMVNRKKRLCAHFSILQGDIDPGRLKNIRLNPNKIELFGDSGQRLCVSSRGARADTSWYNIGGCWRISRSTL